MVTLGEMNSVPRQFAQETQLMGNNFHLILHKMDEEMQWDRFAILRQMTGLYDCAVRFL